MFWFQNGNAVDDGFFLIFAILIYRVLLQFSFMLYLGSGRGEGRNGINKRDRREISELIRTYKLRKLTVLTVAMYQIPKQYRKEKEQYRKIKMFKKTIRKNHADT